MFHKIHLLNNIYLIIYNLYLNQYILYHSVNIKVKLKKFAVSSFFQLEGIKKLATTYFLSRVTHKYLRHNRAWLLCSGWEQVFPLCNHHQKIIVCLAHSKIHRDFIGYLSYIFLWLSPRFISIGQLNTLLYLHPQPIYHVVFMGSYLLHAMGYLILRWASHLDAFSVYPFHT